MRKDEGVEERYSRCALEIISQISQPFSSVFLKKNQPDQANRLVVGL
jgi:hypothetical protein